MIHMKTLFYIYCYNATIFRGKRQEIQRKIQFAKGIRKFHWKTLKLQGQQFPSTIYNTRKFRKILNMLEKLESSREQIFSTKNKTCPSLAKYGLKNLAFSYNIAISYLITITCQPNGILLSHPNTTNQQSQCQLIWIHKNIVKMILHVSP